MTHRGKRPCRGGHPPNEWELSNPRFNGKNHSKISVIPFRVSGRDMAGPEGCQRSPYVKEFIILTDFSRCQDPAIGRVSRRLWRSPSSRQGFCMTFPFPETKTGLRFGLATLAVTGCLAALLAAGPVRAEDNPVLAKVNGVEIRQSDVALAEEELGPSLAQMDPATKKENVLSFLIDLKIVAKAAEDKKVENSEDFKRRMSFTRSRLLMDSLLATEGKAATTDDAMKKVYEEASKQ